MWAACEELDLVVHLHSGAAPMEDYGDHVGMMGIYITEVVWWSVRPIWFLIWGGVFERHPRLKLAITESTTIWVPEALALMDQRYSETHYSAKLGDYRSHLKMKPSEYFHRNVFLGASCMPRREAEMRHADRRSTTSCGARTTRIPKARGPRRASRCSRPSAACPRRELARDARRQRRCASTASTTGKLAPLAARIGPRLRRAAVQRDARERRIAMARLR